jgi:hypothetical protein
MRGARKFINLLFQNLLRGNTETKNPAMRDFLKENYARFFPFFAAFFFFFAAIFLVVYLTEVKQKRN